LVTACVALVGCVMNATVCRAGRWRGVRRGRL
jgi:hypothetical protein